MDDLKEGRIIGYDHYIKMNIIIIVICIVFTILFIATIPRSKLYPIPMIYLIVIFPLIIAGMGATLITERNKILFQIVRDYEKTCVTVEKYLKEIPCKYSLKKTNIPIFNTGTLYTTSLSNFKVQINKSPVLLGIKMSPIKTVKIEDKYLEELIMDKIREV